MKKNDKINTSESEEKASSNEMHWIINPLK
jgi:hypothetical protein